MMCVGIVLLVVVAGWQGTGVSRVDAQDAPRLIIPSIDVNAALTPVYIRRFANDDVTWDVSGLRHNVGVFDQTAPIGTPGNAVLGGHSEQAQGVADVFYNLHRVQVGDDVVVAAGGNQLRYRVISVRSVSLYDLSIIRPTSDERLTIITCDRSSYTGGGYAERVVVVAQRIG
jgi:LPXTG-site transpeptidase (sortase) family protein